jgi:hypothetical protein
MVWLATPRSRCGEVPRGADHPSASWSRRRLMRRSPREFPLRIRPENLRYDASVPGTNLCDGTVCTCRPFRHQVLHGDRDRAPNPPQVAQASFLIAIPISINCSPNLNHATFDFKRGSKWENTRPLYNSVAVAWDPSLVRRKLMDGTCRALSAVGRILQSRGYRFTVVSPATHRRVLCRPALGT